MKRVVLLSLLGLLFALPASAQATTALIWDYPTTTPAYIAAATTHTLTADGVAVPGTPVCAVSPIVATTTTCSLNLPASAITPANHIFVVTLVAEGVQRSTQATIDPTKGKLPGGLRINVSVVVQLP